MSYNRHSYYHDNDDFRITDRITKECSDGIACERIFEILSQPNPPNLKIHSCDANITYNGKLTFNFSIINEGRFEGDIKELLKKLTDNVLKELKIINDGYEESK